MKDSRSWLVKMLKPERRIAETELLTWIKKRRDDISMRLVQEAARRGPNRHTEHQVQLSTKLNALVNEYETGAVTANKAVERMGELLPSDRPIRLI